MAEQFRDAMVERRAFLRHISAAAAAAGLGVSASPSPGAAPVRKARPMPMIQLGPHRVSRMFCGWNPVGGHSHATTNLSKAMVEYFTVDRTVELLENCLKNDITGWQYDFTDVAVQALRKLREKTDQLKVICLHAERPGEASIQKVVEGTRPIAIVHHGGVTDSKFRAGKAQEVRDFVKKVKDAGLLAGVSSHCPANIQRVADEGWENDFFMTCFYYVTRPREEMEKQLGKVPVGEPFFESDPKEMTAVIRQVPKPCLAFKILAAGRVCNNKKSIENAFQYAFQNIKPTDGVIVGMFPRYSDEVEEDAAFAKKYGALSG